jgi:hypothetical protein
MIRAWTVRSVGSLYHTGEEASTSIYFVVRIMFLEASTTVFVLSVTWSWKAVL